MNKVDRMYAEIEVLDKEYDKYDREIAELIRTSDISSVEAVGQVQLKIKELSKKRQAAQDKISELEFEIDNLLMGLE